MTYVLDAQALLWSLTEPDRLSEQARQAVEDQAHTLLISSPCEIATKHRRGRLAGAAVHGYAAA